jgi:uncharacterized iron-regulated protein
LKYFTALLLLSLIAATAVGQLPFSPDAFRAFDGEGREVSLEAIVDAIGSNEVVFLGEQHDDAVGHAVQAEIFRRVVEKHTSDRAVALSLEMFERDVQVVLDEYLGGLITEQHFRSSSRPWTNYETDYKPLVELAKARRLPVIAANAPRRYVNMVSRGGRDALKPLSKDAVRWLAPLPFGEPSAAYAAKFKALMGPSAEAQMGLDKILASQSLWDATMADSVYRFLKDRKNPLVVHLNGSFHTESRLGTVEHLLRYRPKTKALVVTIRYEDDFKSFVPERHKNLGDYVVLTDGKQPRSRR